MEIGFGAGHSAELFLSSNKNVKLLSFDLGEYDYLKLGKKFIDKKYPNRHTLILGDSLETVPNYIKKNSNTKFDVIFVDGGHIKNICFNDMKNCMNLAHKDTIVILDDVKKTDIKKWNIKPNEVWELFNKKNFVTELGQMDFSPTQGVAYGKYNFCEIYIISLLKQERKKYIEINRKKYKNIKVFQAVNGYDINETLKVQCDNNIEYKNLRFKTYGTLACWLSKYKMLKHQVENNIPFVCFLEDDVILQDNFDKFLNNCVFEFKKDINIIRLNRFGEGYITSLESAKTLLKILNKEGICENIDNQLQFMCGKELYIPNNYLKLVVKTNKGDCLKTVEFG